MAKRNYSDNALYRLVVMALLAALVYVGTLVRIPLGSSKVHLANAVCVFAGYILAPVDAGISAGLGSFLYDVTLGGYGLLDAFVTFISKFAMAFVAGILLKLCRRHVTESEELRGEHTPLLFVISAIAALTYTALYMLKSFLWVALGVVNAGSSKSVAAALEGNTLLKGALVYMIGKLPASLINAAVSAFLAPFLYWSVRPSLVKQGVIARLNPPKDK